MVASRELRSLKNEADSLRHELNEWRDRAGIPRIEEPIRNDGFSMVISGELEVLAIIPGEEDDDEMGYGGYDGEDDYLPNGHGLPHASIPHGGIDELNSFSHGMPPQHAHHAQHASGNGLLLAHAMSRPGAQGGGPMIASPTSVTFENPSIPSVFDSTPYPGPPFMPPQSHSVHPLDTEKIAAWNAAQMFQQNSHMAQQQRSMYTPHASHPISSGSPGSSSHGSSKGSVSPGPRSSGSPVSTHSGIAFNEADFYRSHDEREPTITPAISSVRNRGGSLNINLGSPGGSPSYDIGNPGDYGLSVPRRSTHNGVWARESDIGMGALNVGMTMGVGVGMNPVAVGGGNGTGFAMMM